MPAWPSTHSGPVPPHDALDDIELTPEQQERIAALYSQLGGLDLYQLLGVARAADKKTIKRAYNERALAFHPDRFFRKRLGAFKPRLEKIFARLTEAHDVLCSAERRAAYDAVLRTRRESFIEELMEEESEMAGATDASRREEIVRDDDIGVESPSPQRRESGSFRTSLELDVGVRRTRDGTNSAA